MILHLHRIPELTINRIMVVGLYLCLYVRSANFFVSDIFQDTQLNTYHCAFPQVPSARVGEEAAVRA